MPKPTRIGHLVINAKDLTAATKFYTDVIGFEIALERPGFGTFLTAGEQHHDLAIFQAPEGAANTADGDVGLNHMAIEVADFEELTNYWHKLQDHFDTGEIRTTDHGMTKSIYIKDPEGNGIELYCNATATPEEGLALMRSPDRKNTELIFK
ncbi:MAG: VOC family protein [Chloroflexota bacterium]|jgi:catechol 2,3-dioxygenase|nr:VOC family protein [Dehalococcoidia bacterium]MEE3013168.1 VOC family protein [Chloroflexota bacterium]GIS94865.1 MAG: glyoxalase [Dehalococcoidia bacterium]|tara:strand:+ start:798 stop:1253 length:456 start_codon:yes stop_codon:yes gene_type:complete